VLSLAEVSHGRELLRGIQRRYLTAAAQVFLSVLRGRGRVHVLLLGGLLLAASAFPSAVLYEARQARPRTPSVCPAFAFTCVRAFFF